MSYILDGISTILSEKKIIKKNTLDGCCLSIELEAFLFARPNLISKPPAADHH